MPFPARDLLKEKACSRRTTKENLRRSNVMLRAALLFLVIALIAGLLGLFHVEWLASEVAWILFVVFLILFVVSLVVGRGRPPIT
jgi:uncharacterized membrane protein YtjA (UPF0391 family)